MHIHTHPGVPKSYFLPIRVSVRIQECQKSQFLPIRVWQQDTCIHALMDVDIFPKSPKYLFSHMKPNFIDLSCIWTEKDHLGAN